MGTPFSLNNQLIVVTGASSGIGEACCQTMDNAGARIVLVARNREKLFRVAENLHNEPIVYPADLTDPSSFSALSNHLVELGAKVNGFVHAAGIQMTFPLRNLSADRFNELMSLNVFAGLELSKQFSHKRLLPDMGASYVMISSIVSQVGRPGLIAYSASKGALIAACRSMALELASKSIRVNCVSPGHILTDMTLEAQKYMSEEYLQQFEHQHPLGFGQPDDVANAVLYLLAPASRWVTGTNLIVDGGFSA